MLSKLLTGLFGLLKDSRGKKSWTHTIGVPAFTAITLKFVIGGTHIVIGAWGTKPALDLEFSMMSGLDYATAAGCVLAYLTARAWTPSQIPPTATPTVQPPPQP